MNRYAANISRGLDRVHWSARVLSQELNTARMVIFSDHHRGVGDEADDFRQCEASYHGALIHYLAEGYTLVLAGDVEELWEVNPQPVLEHYRGIYSDECAFYERNAYWRLYGNHDDNWSHRDLVDKFLGGLFPQVAVLEALRISMHEDGAPLGELLIVHGHQGTTFSDRFRWLGRLVIRFFWRPFQRLTKVKATTPATDWRLRHKHDVAMYGWASRLSRFALIAGHTHHPIFPSLDRLAALTGELDRALRGDEPREVLADLTAELEMAQIQARPCYFNTGCCSFSDGSITGVEINSSDIRLVRWKLERGHPTRDVLGAADLREVFGNSR